MSRSDDVISSFRSSCYRLPREAFWPHRPPERPLPMSDVSLVTFEVETASGHRGLGYTLNINRGNGGKLVQAALDLLAGPALIGRPVTHPELCWDLLQAELGRMGRGGVAGLALSAADIAIWDLRARLAGLPLHELLGARRLDVAAYGSAFDRLYSDEDAIRSAQEYLDAGLSAVKIRLGHPSLDDRHRLAIMREALGARTSIMVDVNANWDLPTALSKLAMLEEFGVQFLEEPIAPHDADGFAELQRRTCIPIAGGESLYTLPEFLRFVQARAIMVVQPDIGRVGGVTGWLRIAQLCDAFGLAISSHLMQEVAVHTLCSVRNAGWLEYVPVFSPIFEAPLAIGEDGRARPSKVPGTGVRFRDELILPYRI